MRSTRADEHAVSRRRIRAWYGGFAPADVEAIAAHVAATTFERRLRGHDLGLAVEGFFASWPTKKGGEMTETDVRGNGNGIDTLFAESEESIEVAKENPVSQRTRKTVLVVDDSSMIRFAVTEAIKKLGHGVIEAGDGKEALDKIQLEAPDLVILDLLMPEKSGMDILRELHASPAIKAVPVIVLTSVTDRKIISKTVALGVKDYIVKPPDSADLKRRVHKYLS